MNRLQNTSKTTPENAINIFGEAARGPICDNMVLYCHEWRHKRKQIDEITRLLPLLPTDQTELSLHGIYKIMLQRLQRELRRTENHLQHLRYSLELLERKQIFTKPVKDLDYLNITELKDQIDIVAVIGESVELRAAGQSFTGCCPFHQDRSPSFAVYPESKRWWCFSCAEGGDVISFVQKIYHCNFNEAITRIQSI